MKQPGQEKDGRKTEIKALIGPAAAIYEPIGEPVSTGLSISRPISRPISPLIFIYFLFFSWTDFPHHRTFISFSHFLV